MNRILSLTDSYSTVQWNRGEQDFKLNSTEKMIHTKEQNKKVKYSK